MWEKIQCDYFIELVVVILEDIVDILSKENINNLELEARKSNFYYASKKFEDLVLSYSNSNPACGKYNIFIKPVKTVNNLILELNNSLGRKDRQKYRTKILEYIQLIRRLQQKLL